MRIIAMLRYAAAGLALGAGALSVAKLGPPAQAQSQIVQDGRAGFVVTQFSYAMARDASETGACPNGLSQTYANIGDVIANRPDLQRRPEETDSTYSARTGAVMFGTPDNFCRHPEQAPADPLYRTVTGAQTPVVGGVDLDGQVSRTSGRAAPGTCAHDDFRGANGDRGVDNQFFRIFGCSPGFQSDGQSNDLVTEMLTGSWGILLTLRGVDDVRNDPDVEVGLYANGDPIQLSPTREPLTGVTYSAVADPRFRATTHGRIVNGVLTTDPADARFYSVFNTVRTERPLRDARVRLTWGADGALEGYLAGYTPVEELYDVQVGFRNGAELSGAPASNQLINTRSIGQAFTMGKYTCQGAYQAILANADGHRDPATGRCTSVSTQYRIRAVPAFVAD